MVLRTVRSLGSSLMTFSYSAMAFCSLPCWTNFSAELSTFALLNPNPSAIESLNEGSFYRRGKTTIIIGLKYHIHAAKTQQQGRFPLVISNLPYEKVMLTELGMISELLHHQFQKVFIIGRAGIHPDPELCANHLRDTHRILLPHFGRNIETPGKKRLNQFNFLHAEPCGLIQDHIGFGARSIKKQIRVFGSLIVYDQRTSDKVFQTAVLGIQQHGDNPHPIKTRKPIHHPQKIAGNGL